LFFSISYLIGPTPKCPNLSGSGMCPWTSIPDAELHLEVIANLLLQINADIVVIEEVQDCVALQCVIEAMGDSSYRPYLIEGTDIATMQNVGMITRVDPDESVVRTNLRATVESSSSSCGNLPDPQYESGVSKNIIARFTVNSIPITLVGVHFLSQPTNPTNCIKREAQASVIRRVVSSEFLHKRISAKNPQKISSEVIVLGDFNDYDRQVLDVNDNLPTSRVSTWITHNFQNEQILWNVAARVPKIQRFTSWYDKDQNCEIKPDDELSMIDHIFVSKSLFNSVSSVKIWNSIDISCGTFQSDHYAVHVVFDVNNK